MTATMEAIQKAERKATEEGHLYNVTRFESSKNLFFVTREGTDRCYIVSTYTNRCTCKAWENNGVCKHGRLVHEFIEAEDMAEMEAARADFDAYAKY